MLKRKPKQATRKAAQADKGKNQMRFVGRALLLLFMTLSVAWGWIQLNNPKIFPISKVQLVGSYQHVSHQALQSAIGYGLTQGFFDVNVDDIRNNLLAIPWVADANVRRVWPNKLKIKLIEQQPVAVWNDKFLLNNQGELFAPPVSSFPTNLPIFDAPRDQQKLVLSSYHDMNNILSPLQLSITKIDLSPRHSWRIKLSNGMQVVLGRDNVMARLTRFVQVYAKVFAGRGEFVDYVDLRYANGMAVRWKNG